MSRPLAGDVPPAVLLDCNETSLQSFTGRRELYLYGLRNYPQEISAMKHVALLVLALASPLLASDGAKDPQASQPFAPGGSIRLHLGPGGYTITDTKADAIQITYTTRRPDDMKKVKVKIQTSGSSADVSVSDTPHNNFQATIEIPRHSNLRVRMFAGEVVINGVEGDKDVEVSAGRVEIKVPHPDEYGHRDASVHAGSIEASAFNVSKGGLFRSFSQKGAGKYRLHAHVATGEIDLPGPI
jgi:hypothetical protein